MHKYSDEEFTAASYFSDDEGESNHDQKIVKIRKQQSCCGFFGEGRHDIEPGTRAIRETVLFENEGWRSNYLCLDCATRIIDIGNS
jgi:hypothetical protein